MKKIGCLVLLLLVAWLSLETWVFMLLADWIGVRWFDTALAGYLPVAITCLVCVAIGIRIAKYHGSRIMGGLLTGDAGRHAVGALAGVLLAIPGVILKVPALILLLPLTQRLLGATATLVLGAIVRRQMAAMLGGKGGSLFPGGGGFPFPGQPDDRSPFPGMKPRSKTIDTTAERS